MPTWCCATAPPFARVSSSAHAILDDDLVPATAYEYRVRAIDAAANAGVAALAIGMTLPTAAIVVPPVVTPPTSPPLALHVALGDSYSSGAGAGAASTPDPTPADPSRSVTVDMSVYEADGHCGIDACARTSNNAARRVAAAKGYTLRDVWCSGVVTENLVTAGQHSRPAQVTQRAPSAQVRIAGYPYIVPMPRSPIGVCSGIVSDAERVLMKSRHDATNAAIQAAAAASAAKVRYVDPNAAGSPFSAVGDPAGRDVCGTSASRWINGAIDQNAFSGTHPNSIGYDFYAQAYLATL